MSLRKPSRRELPLGELSLRELSLRDTPIEYRRERVKLCYAGRTTPHSIAEESEYKGVTPNVTPPIGWQKRANKRVLRQTYHPPLDQRRMRVKECYAKRNTPIGQWVGQGHALGRGVALGQGPAASKWLPIASFAYQTKSPERTPTHKINKTVQIRSIREEDTCGCYV